MAFHLQTKQIVITALISAGITALIFWAGITLTQNRPATETLGRKIAYWKAPMDPTEIYEQPGKSKMGMDLVPVYEDELTGGVDITIDPVVVQNMGLRIEPATLGPVHHTIKTYGHITFDETRTGTVSQKTSGWVEKLHADYTGFYTVKGQPLYELYAPALMASQEEYLSAFKTYQNSQTPANAEFLTSARKRLTYFDIADVDIAAIESDGTVQKTLTIRSPYTGIVTEKNVIEGAFIKEGQSLFVISDLSQVWVEAHIFEYEQHHVAVGQTVEMQLSYFPDKVYKGTISYIFPYLQKQTRDVVIRIAFDNKLQALKPDMFTKISIQTDPGRNGIFIPSEAVIHTGEKKIVFVSKAGGRFTPQPVQTGIYMDDGQVEILNGLNPGDPVVVSGQFLLDSESRLREAVRKMATPDSSEPKDQKTDDDFFNDMEPNDDFFTDMESTGEAS